MLASLTPTSRAVLTIAAQHGIDAGNRLGLPNEVGIARDFVVEDIAGVDHLGIDIEGKHPVGELTAA